MVEAQRNGGWTAIIVTAILTVLAAATAAPAQTFETLANFGGTNGASPSAPVVQGTDGNLYGTTSAGGAGNDEGTVFKVTPTGILTTLYSFCAQPNCADGAVPLNGLLLGTDENFYGTTSQGGAKGYGTLFKITPEGTFTTIHSFVGGPTDGAFPNALIQGTDGNFYGTTFGGGTGTLCSNVCGTVFKNDAGGQAHLAAQLQRS